MGWGGGGYEPPDVTARAEQRVSELREGSSERETLGRCNKPQGLRKEPGIGLVSRSHSKSSEALGSTFTDTAGRRVGAGEQPMSFWTQSRNRRMTGDDTVFLVEPGHVISELL